MTPEELLKYILETCEEEIEEIERCQGKYTNYYNEYEIGRKAVYKQIKQLIVSPPVHTDP